MRTWMLLNAIALALCVGWVAVLTLPYQQAVRLRNAFLLRRGNKGSFAWTPADVPAGFKVEQRRPPAVIEAAVFDVGLQADADDWARMRALVSMLVRRWRFEGPIRADLATTYKGILAGGGYCSDYVRVYLAAAHGARLFCRQWAFSFDGFGGHGHTFVETFDRQRGRWVFLDVHNNVYAVAKGNDLPLDALSVRDLLLSSPSDLEFRQIGPGRLGFPHFDKLLDYYLRGADQWYLCWGNDVITRDASPSGLISGRLAHRLGSATGNLPPIVVLVTDRNEAHVRRMIRLRWQATFAIALALALLAAFGFQYALPFLGQGRGQ